MHNAAVVREFAGLLVNFKARERVRILASRQQPLSARVEIKIPRCSAANVLAFDKRQLAGILINPEDRDGVMPAICRVHKLP